MPNHSRPDDGSPVRVPATCRKCGRVYGMISLHRWQQQVQGMHNMVCPQCGSRADASQAKLRSSDYPTQHAKGINDVKT